MHAVSDLVTAGAYFAIPAAILTFVRKRSDLTVEHRRIALLFVAFIVACGLTHLIGFVTLWSPIYGFQALVKAATAAVSLTTAFLVWPLVPRLLALPTPGDLATANRRLVEEIAAKNSALAALEDARATLELQVAERTRELALVAERFETAIQDSPVTMFEQDRELRYTWIANNLNEVDAALGRTDEELIADPGVLVARKREALATGEPQRFEAPLAFRSGVARIYRMKVSPIHGEEGVVGLRAVAIDVTAEREAQERLEIVMRELAHRSKNLMAVVMSLVSQIGRSSGAPPGVFEGLGQRLQALGRAYDVIVAGQWRSVRLSDVINQQLAPLNVGGRIALAPDDDLEVRPDAAQMIALVIHELATNAMKHGALAFPAGLVDLSWGREKGRAVVRWRERLGRPVTLPERAGFGRSLLETLAPRALRGEARLLAGEEGLSYEIVFDD